MTSYIFFQIDTTEIHPSDATWMRNNKLRTILRQEYYNFVVCDTNRPNKYFTVVKSAEYVYRLKHSEEKLKLDLQERAAAAAIGDDENDDDIENIEIDSDVLASELERSGLANKRRQMTNAEVWTVAEFTSGIANGILTKIQL